MECGVAHALDVIGDRWSLLILWSAFNGAVHFEQFLTILGIARNILANRLANMVRNGIMERARCHFDGRRIEYKLTDKGVDLLPAIIAIWQWDTKYKLGTASTPVLIDKRDRMPIKTVGILGADGRDLEWSDLKWVQGRY